MNTLFQSICKCACSCTCCCTGYLPAQMLGNDMALS